eukprot:TRINITY_DN14674_c0_g1_i1.p2 TRINITY_DN14674_c0_g1~~TRINITY_DN14674_c0_g1_i1.p2  ORF type:complete len:167 (-),score=32.56 TRINITY_DN14674_c0_g1_i1:163-663(-)
MGCGGYYYPVATWTSDQCGTANSGLSFVVPGPSGGYAGNGPLYIRIGASNSTYFGTGNFSVTVTSLTCEAPAYLEPGPSGDALYSTVGFQPSPGPQAPLCGSGADTISDQWMRVAPYSSGTRLWMTMTGHYNASASLYYGCDPSATAVMCYTPLISSPNVLRECFC